MAYEFDLGELEGLFTDRENSLIIEFVLGVDPDTDKIVVMSVILFPTAQADKWELCFGIRTKSGPELDDISEPDYSKECAETYIPKEYNSQVLARIRRAVVEIASRCNSTYIIMETFYPNLPPKALIKYITISNELFDLNYLVEEEWKDEQSGINYWLFKKKGQN
jgi:hypothetical protein